MDFNYNPLCATVGQHDRTGTMWTFKEFILKKASTWDLCEEFITEFKSFKGDICVYGDATGRRRDTRSRTSDYLIIRQKLNQAFPGRVKFKIPKSNPPIRDRLNSVNALLKNANGDVNYLIHPDCRKSIVDFETVETPSETMPFQIDKRDAAGNPKTHLTDSIGYFITKEHPVLKPTYSSLSGG